MGKTVIILCWKAFSNSFICVMMKSNIATPSAKNTIMHSSNINSISHYFFIISSTFFLSIFICVTILLWKNCKSPLSSSPTKNNNTNTTKNDIDDPHHDYINIKSRNNNKNMIFINHNNSNYDNQSFISDVTCSRSEFIYYSNN